MPSTFQMGGVAGVPMAEAGDRALFGRRRSSPVTTAQNAAPEPRRLEPDSRAPSGRPGLADNSPWAAHNDQ
jgi:hypothetical protein